MELIAVRNHETKISVTILPCDNEKLYIDSPMPFQSLLEMISIKLKVKSVKFTFEKLIQQCWSLLKTEPPTDILEPHLPYYLCSEDSVVCSCESSIQLRILPCSEFCVLYWNIILLPTFNIHYSFDDSKLIIGYPCVGNQEDTTEDLTSQLPSQEVKELDLKRKTAEIDKRLFKMNGVINEKEDALIKHLKETF
eukprot:GAHX01001093.1.p1 GENE.GAHX01001093.1~~GAHX01001093.1.p1  ORF type:complete len:204 (-),score=29.08 GAHX01001093.1:320-901(-)